MSILNPNVNTTSLSIGTTWAKLASVDGKLVYDFLVNPEEVAWNHSVNMKELNVIRTGQPGYMFVNSVSTLSFPTVLFWTPGFSGSLKTALATVTAMTKPVNEVLPLLSLSWGNLNEPRVYLKTFQFREQQWRSGTPTQAAGSMDFVIVPTAAATQKSEGSVFLEREQRDYAGKLKTFLKTNKAKASSLGWKNQAITVGADGLVKFAGKTVGNIRVIAPEIVANKHRTV